MVLESCLVLAPVVDCFLFLFFAFVSWNVSFLFTITFAHSIGQWQPRLAGCWTSGRSLELAQSRPESSPYCKTYRVQYCVFEHPQTQTSDIIVQKVPGRSSLAVAGTRTRSKQASQPDPIPPYSRTLKECQQDHAIYECTTLTALVEVLG